MIEARPIGRAFFIVLFVGKVGAIFRRRHQLGPDMTERKSTYAEFWPFYLQEHARPATRQFHYIGTALVICIAAFALLTQRWLLLLAMPVAGYFFAWVSHAFVEKNKPATFTHPLWSLISDFRMFFFWLAGKLDRELEAAGVLRADNDPAD